MNLTKIKNECYDAMVEAIKFSMWLLRRETNGSHNMEG
jgi:hypothetical protein